MDARGLPPAVAKLVSPGLPVCLKSKPDASRHALPSEAIVVGMLILAAEFEGVLAPDHREVVREHLDQVFAAVVGIAAPLAIAVGEGELQQVLVAVRHVQEADLLLPVNAADDGRLRWVVILFPIVAAAVEVVEHGGEMA